MGRSRGDWATAGAKRCGKCGGVKPLSEFHRRSASPDGVQPLCKVCNRAKRRAYYEANKQRELARGRQYRRLHREEAAARFRAYTEPKKHFLQAVRETCGCIECGTSEGRLGFEYRPGTVKTFKLRQESSWASLVEQLDKVDVRCYHCRRGPRYSGIPTEELIALYDSGLSTV